MTFLVIEGLVLMLVAALAGCFAGWILRPILVETWPRLATLFGNPNPVEAAIDQINAPFASLLGFSNDAPPHAEVTPLNFRGTSWFDDYLHPRD
jgi:hypothetical protein